MNNDCYSVTEAENNFGPCLVLKEPWSDDYIDVIKENDISVLRLTESMGWKEKEISFLEKLKDINLRGVEIYSWDVKDITPLHYLPGLEYIGLQCAFTKAPSFSFFKSLRHFFLYWRPKAKTIFDCPSLKTLNIVNYPAEDLQEAKNFLVLEQLQLTSRKLRTLLGIESLKSLRILDLAECPKLESLDGVDKCQQIKIVEIENCKKVNDISCLGENQNLENLALIDCAKIKSLRQLTKCRLLKNLSFTGDTNVEDGDLTPLLDIPELKKMWFADRNHYSHKRDEIAAKLS